MTEQQINVAIAEACPDVFGVHPESGEVFRWLDEEGIHVDTCDIVNDLNAMHEAWLTLDESQQHAFWGCLHNVLGGRTTNFKAANATARQRAEAFLRTIGKWKD